jgi:carboxypeptidase Taq
MPSEKFSALLERSRTLADLNAANAVLNWDQETYMPQGAAEIRAEQISTLSALVHQMTVDPGYVGLLDDVNAEAAGGALEEWERRAVREAIRTRDHALKLPEELVREIARVTSLAQHAWKKARVESNFGHFAEILSRLVDLKRREAELYGYRENIYDALIDLFEPGMTVSQLRPVFDQLRDGTRRLLQKIADSGSDVDDAILFTGYDKEKQLAFSRDTVQRLGFDFNTGRIDLSAHPFCTSFGISDVRLTTRIYTDDLRSCLFGLIHESGHGMYEQGIDPAYARTPVGAAISMGIHESQSLFWENMIGRSEPFWNWCFPRLRSVFPEQLASIAPFEFFRAINVMKPSFIRVEADELTYNLHIILRFEIEEALINGTIDVADIPAVWNEKMQTYLGIVPPNDAVGCLQDVHWSFGGFGYFPSYTLGKLYAAMFFKQMSSDLADVNGQIERGEFGGILSWLRENIHRCGLTKTAGELVQDVCGKPLGAVDFLEYVESKIDRVYAQQAVA